MYRNVGRTCGALAGLGLFGYSCYTFGVANGDGPAVSLHAHITAALALAVLAHLAVVAWMLRDLERRLGRRSIELKARFAALVREAVVSDEVRDMLEGFLRRAVTRGMVIERSPATGGSKPAATKATVRMRVVGSEEI